MQPCHRLLCLLLTLALVLPGPAGAQSSVGDALNVVLHKQIGGYTGTNDCWGYTSPGGVELAIYGHETGTSFVDATDPPNAVEVFNLPGASSTWRDIKTYQNYAYIVTEGGGPGTGLQIVDLTDPLNPVHISTYTGSGMTTAHNIWIDTGAGVAYCCGADGGGTHILSLADPENPVQLDYFNSYYIHDLYVGNGMGYAGAISSGSLRIFDASNPSNPNTLATQFYSGAATHNAWPTANEQYCVTSDEVGGGHLKIWDISNLGNITLESEWEVTRQDAIIHNAIIRDDMVYMAYYGGGSNIVDITDPSNPIEIGYYDTSNRGAGFGGNWGIYPFRSDDVFYASDRQNGLFILELIAGFAGDISGTVRDALTTTPLDSAVVTLTEGLEFEVDGSGNYGGSAGGRTYTIVTTRFGYAPDTTDVLVPEFGAVVHDVDLTPLPIGAVKLDVVHSGSLADVEGAVVGILGSPITGLLTNSGGEVVLTGVPIGLPWTVRVGKFGFELTDYVVSSTEGDTTSFQLEIHPGFHDDFDDDQAWSVGDVGDDATDGIWERETPVGSYYVGPVGPSEDATETGAGVAFITEQHVPGAFVGTSDVDNGKTTLLSPVFDGSGFGTLTLNYQRWFSNRAPSPEADEFRADVSTDGGSSWTNLETMTVGDDAWGLVSIELNSVVTPTATMQLRFVAEDEGSNTYVEAGIDDVEILSSATDAPSVETRTRDLALRFPTPNPFHTSTEIAFDLPTSGPARVEIFDVSGRKVATLLAGERVGAGTHRTRWSGRGSDGSRVTPGVYFAKLSTPAGIATRKVTLLK